MLASYVKTFALCRRDGITQRKFCIRKGDDAYISISAVDEFQRSDPGDVTIRVPEWLRPV
jgi:hypothetical protein